MKQLFVFISGLLIISTSIIYIYIPSEISVSVYRNLFTTASGTIRIVSDTQTWKKWFPQQHYEENSKLLSATDYTIQGDTFYFKKASYNNITIQVRNRSGIQATQLIFIPVREDSLVLNWRYITKSSYNPLKRFTQYKQAVNTKKNMDSILSMLATYCTSSKNVYGINIVETSTIDTQLVFKSLIVKTLPSINTIYQQVSLLQLYIKENGAKQTGHPMVNVISLENKSYRLMVALPTDRILSGAKNIVYKRMVPGLFLTTVVIGGEGQVRVASQQIQQYIEDYQLIVMAEPFQVLITDRTKETDSSKWETKLFFPVK